MTVLSSFHKASSSPLSSEHEMKLDDPITTECCHTVNTKGRDCAGFCLALIYQLVTEVRGSKQARDKRREGGFNKKSEMRHRMKQESHVLIETNSKAQHTLLLHLTGAYT